ncbi:hypothetical protein N9E16_00980, partial [Planktomarina temperata]|nr:hypothetical protein [Planktomarina temperata]
AGPVVNSSYVEFVGTELNNEMRERLGVEIVRMVLSVLEAPRPPIATQQKGQTTWYRRRTPADSELNVNKTIAEQFELLRTVDNDEYPAFFKFRGDEYVLKIEKRGRR